jgi:CubicO group peptidase (beta-lactamase class C family)
VDSVNRFPAATRVLEKAIADRVFPGAVVDIGRTAGAIGNIARGSLSFAPDSRPAARDTVYDLASLTKVLATAAVMAGLFSSGRMRFDDPVRQWIESWAGDDRQDVTIQDLLEHASGLPAHRQYYKTLHGRAAFEAAICAEPLEYAPRTRSLYSDPGFMLLGFAVENAGGAPLDRLFDQWRRREVGADVELSFSPKPAWLERTAPTEVDRFGQEKCGVVHDENAEALDGVAAHAGLFGTALAVGACARWWLTAPALARFSRKSTVPGSSRALAWDTMLPTSSCGTKLSPHAIGHTGFTGTSLWIDPTRDLYVAFLSNRVHPTREREGIQEVRRALHDAVVTDLSE